MLLKVVSDLLAEDGSLRVGGAEVDPAPYSGVDDLLECVRQALKAARGTGFVAERAEADLVGAEKVLERVNDCTAYAGVPRGVVGEGRRDKRRRVADRCGWVEQRQPVRVRLGIRIAVGDGLANRRNRTPELPVILVVPAANQGISRSQILHREQASIFYDVQVLAGCQRARDPVPKGRWVIILPEDRSIGLVHRSGRAVE